MSGSANNILERMVDQVLVTSSQVVVHMLDWIYTICLLRLPQWYGDTWLAVDLNLIIIIFHYVGSRRSNKISTSKYSWLQWHSWWILYTALVTWGYWPCTSTSSNSTYLYWSSNRVHDGILCCSSKKPDHCSTYLHNHRHCTCFSCSLGPAYHWNNVSVYQVLCCFNFCLLFFIHTYH